MTMQTLRAALLLALVLAGCAPSPAASPTSAPATPTVTATPEPAAATALPDTPTPLPPTDTPEPPTATPEAAALLGGDFHKQEVDVSGSYTYDPATGQITFSEDFRVVDGPDLYVVLSGAEDVTLDYPTFSRIVTESPLLNLGLLQSTGGAQTYAVPDGTDLSLYRSVVVWCQQYSVAFAAARLEAQD